MKTIICSLGVIAVYLFFTVPALALEQKTDLYSLTKDKNDDSVNVISLTDSIPDSSEGEDTLPETKGLSDMYSKSVYSNNPLKFSLTENRSRYSINERLLNSQPIKPNPVPTTSKALDFEFNAVLKGSFGMGAIDVAAAYFTEIMIHEIGHDVIADYVGAKGSSLTFFTNEEDQFFIGKSTVDWIDTNSRASYNMAGAFAADLTFEYALRRYREAPTLYNKALMLFSGTDFLRNTLYAFYISDGHDHHDANAVTKYSAISKETVLFTAVAKTLINAHRMHSGSDKFIPYFTLGKDSVTLNLAMSF